MQEYFFKALVHHYENMSPISFLSVQISGFLTFAKATNWTWEYIFLQHLSIKDIIYLIYIQWELNTGPTIHMTVLEFWISLVWVQRHHEQHKKTWLSLSCCEQVAYVDFISFFIMKTRILYGENGLVRNINGLFLETKYLTQPIFQLGFHWGFHVNKIGAQGSNLCDSVYSPSWNGLHYWVV